MGVVIILFSLSSIIALLLAAIALGQSSRAGRNASAAKRNTIGADEKRKLVELSGKMASLEPHLEEFEKRENEAVERLEKLETELSGRGSESETVKQHMQKNAAELMELSLRMDKLSGEIESFKQFQSMTEEVHRRIVGVFSTAQAGTTAEVDSGPDEISTEPEEDIQDTEEQLSEPVDDDNNIILQ